MVMVATGQARELATLAALVFCLGLTADLFRPASQALVADLVAPEFRVKAFGTQYWAINLGFAFAAADYSSALQPGRWPYEVWVSDVDENLPVLSGTLTIVDVPQRV